MLDIAELKKILTDYKSEIESLVADKVKEQSTAADKQITDLVAKQADIEKGLEALKKQEQNQDSFGLPGLEYEKKNWSWTKFFRAMYEQVAAGKGNCPVVSDPWKQAAFEKDVIDQYAKRRGMEVMDLHRIRAQTSDDGSQGGFLVPPEITSEIVDMAIANMPVLQMPGVMRLNGLRGDLPVPKLTSRHTGYHIGENEKPTESTAAFGLEWFRPKKVGAFTKQSNRLLYQSSGVSDTIIKRLLSESMALEQHNNGLINGTGSDSKPLGIMNTSGMTTTIGGVSIDNSTAVQLVPDDLLQQQQALAHVDELRDTPSYGYLMHPGSLFGLKRFTVKQYSGQARKEAAPALPGMLMLSTAKLEELIGYAIRQTTHISAAQTVGSSTTSSTVIFGDWSLYWYATWRDLVFRVSDQAGDGSTGSAFLEDQLYMVAFMEYDARIMRAAAFSKKAGIETNPGSWT